MEIRSYEDEARRYIELEEHPEFRAEMQRLLDEGNRAELEDRFYKDLEFGTGGLRGVIGAGFNRMNPYTVRRATLGLVRYMRMQGKNEPGSIVIAYDSRRFSPEFADAAALVCAAEGIKAYVFESLRPTPELSFAVRFLGADAGIVVTASHNPPEYNGYKVYWNDGAQVVHPHDLGIIEQVRRVSGKVRSIGREEAEPAGLYERIGESIDSSFLAMVKRYLRRTEALEPRSGSFSIVYTPLHGTGAVPVERLFKDLGIPCTVVPEQRTPDGEFPTVESPNPEEGKALQMAIDLAAEVGADLVMGTDPDADRLGIAVRDADSGYRLITGNQLGSLLADYVLRTHEEFGTMPRRPALVKTIVTTELLRRIGESHGVRVYDVLTGFKYIGEKIREFERSGEHYVFGAEESYGYLVETEVRDKDGVSTAAVTAEMALYCRSKGASLLDYLEELYARFGYFEEMLESRRFEGPSGAEKTRTLMEGLRTRVPTEFAGLPVVEFLDYRDGSVFRSGTRVPGTIDLPRSDVVQFKLPGAIFTVRPSGTEPKVKFYASCWEDPTASLDEAKRRVRARLEAIRSAVSRL